MTVGLSIYQVSLSLGTWVSFLAVAVTAMMCTSGDIWLRTSPSIENSHLKKSPLQITRKTNSLYRM